VYPVLLRAVHSVPGVPAGDTQDHLYDERDRYLEAPGWLSVTCRTVGRGPGICVLDVVICRRPARGFRGGSEFVQRVVVPGSRLESWTIVGDDAAPVEPAERYLAFLSDVGRSPNTVKAYAHDLKDWFVFLAGRAAD
jgi:hypothetical protein